MERSTPLNLLWVLRDSMISRERHLRNAISKAADRFRDSIESLRSDSSCGNSVTVPPHSRTEQEKLLPKYQSVTAVPVSSLETTADALPSGVHVHHESNKARRLRIDVHVCRESKAEMLPIDVRVYYDGKEEVLPAPLSPTDAQVNRTVRKKIVPFLNYPQQFIFLRALL